MPLHHSSNGGGIKTRVREGSWFSGNHLLLEQAVKLAYYCQGSSSAGSGRLVGSTQLLTGGTSLERFVFKTVFGTRQ